ncbi:MAG: phosphate signaling complex protein PhoU, partial [Candidatus Didemnitutus sp.]|nr:phosphate signaling complex protein PhoU [Candidatus Didemnitutus sp.]
AMASHAESAVSRAIRALTERDDALALQVQKDDRILDQFEIKIDDIAIHLLAMAPLASDLRLITVAMKISQNLERVGDEAGSMARRIVDLVGEPQLQADTAIPQMARLCLAMLREALTAFVERDPQRARQVIPQDQEVDAHNRELHRALSSFMVEDPGKITRCLALMAISRSLERVADHATNIAEEVVYLYEGRDIRHSSSHPQ